MPDEACKYCGQTPGVDGPVESHAMCIAIHSACRTVGADKVLQSLPVDFDLTPLAAKVPRVATTAFSAMPARAIPPFWTPPFKVPISG